MARSSDVRRGGRSPRSTAPTHHVPQERIVSIEHPCIVKNFDNGLKSLGGEPQIKHVSLQVSAHRFNAWALTTLQVLEHKVGDGSIKVDGKLHVLPEPVVGVSLRPNDPLAKKVASTGVNTRNVLVKVTLPKWTGRKRKRGSDGPFTTPSPPELHSNSIKAPQLLQRLRDNQSVYSLQPLGTIQETHRFRSQPDFQMHTGDLSSMAELKDHATEANYDILKRFRVDLRPGSRDITAFPLPATFTPNDQPYRYEYQQAPDIVFKADDNGNMISRNTSAKMLKLQFQAIAPDAKEVPQGPPPDLKCGSMSEEALKNIRTGLSQLLDKRPLVTRRVALSVLPDVSRLHLDTTAQWVAYTFSAGPWRDVLIKYGVDPRADPKYRFYQALTFLLDRNTVKMSDVVRSQAKTRPPEEQAGSDYMFDGTSITTGGHTWQVCDVTDPLLYDLLHTDDLRTECDAHQVGWYHFGTLAKARVIMRDKFKCLLSGVTPHEDDYKALLTAPENIISGPRPNIALDRKQYSQRMLEFGKECRSLARAYKLGRQSKADLIDGRLDGTLDGGSVREGEAEEESDDESDEEGDLSEMERLDSERDEDSVEAAEAQLSGGEASQGHRT